MDAQNSLRFAESWQVSHRRDAPWLYRIISALGATLKKTDSGVFEFSLIEGSDSLRMLHLDFPSPDLSAAEKSDWLQKRARRIMAAAALAPQKTRHWTESILNLTRASLMTGCPLQVGFEASSQKAALKLYLSAMGTPLRALDPHLGAACALLEGPTKAGGIDSLGLTVRSDGSREWKIYAYYPPPMPPALLKNIQARADRATARTQPWRSCGSLIKRLPLKHWGPMYRMSGELPCARARVNAIKFWARMTTPLPPERLIPAPKGIRRALKTISLARGRVSYLTWEQGRCGLYFR